jgi:large subunit ribosomal protein L30e
MAETVSDLLKKAASEKKLVVGSDVSIKAVKSGSAKQVLVSRNCPDGVRKDIERYAKLVGVEVNVLEYSNEELGILCKKPFSISVACVVK